jgi:hypothetical protein
MNIRSKRNIGDYIQIFDNIMTPYACQLILSEYKKSKEWIHKDNQGIIKISTEYSLLINKKIRQLIDCSVHRIITELIKKNDIYDIDFIQSISYSSDYEIVKNDSFFEINYNQCLKSIDKSLGIIYCSIQLNDDYEGGEFSLFDGEIFIRPKIGSVLIFPLTYMFPYEIMPIIKGSKYSIVTTLK